MIFTGRGTMLAHDTSGSYHPTNSDKYASRWAFISGNIHTFSDGLFRKNSPFVDSILKVLRENKEDELNISTLANIVRAHSTNQIPMCSPIANTGHNGGEFIFYLKDPIEAFEKPEYPLTKIEELYKEKGHSDDWITMRIKKIAQTPPWNKRIYSLVIGSEIGANVNHTNMEMYQTWLKRQTADYAYFTALSAFPLHLTADLLYKLWQNFKHTESWLNVPRLAVSDLLLSGLLHETSNEVFEYPADLRQHLLRALQYYFQPIGRQILKELATFMLDYLATHYVEGIAYTEPIREVEEWNALAYFEPGLVSARLTSALNNQNNYQTRQLRAVRLTATLEQQQDMWLPSSLAASFGQVITLSRATKAYIREDYETASTYFQQLPEFNSYNPIDNEQSVIVELPKNFLPKKLVLPPTEIALQRINAAKSQRSTSLDLSNLGLNEIPKEVMELNWLNDLLLCNNADIKDLGILQYLTNLQNLDVSLTKVSDLGSLAALVNLRQLKVVLTQVSDLSPLRGLTNLQILYLSETQISNLSPLSSLTQLQTLDCSSTQVSNLSPLSNLTKLQVLDCSYTQISDLSPLAVMTQLQRLNCSYMQISDLSPLAALTQLQRLYCHSTQVSDLSPLTALSQLQTLYCSYTQVSSLSSLSTLTQLHTFNCSYTQVSDLLPLAALTHLQMLDCSYTQVSDLLPLAALTHLQMLDCSYCHVRQVLYQSCCTGFSAIVPFKRFGQHLVEVMNEF